MVIDKKETATKTVTKKELYEDYIRQSGDSQGKTQAAKILKYMLSYGSITQSDAFNLGYGSRLAARISDLRAAGIPIKTKMEKNTRTDGRHARYYLEV